MFCGVDEAGRGSVMGPLVVGAVFVEDDSPLVSMGVRDSKRLSPRRREALYEEISSAAPDWCTVIVSAEEIDLLRNRRSLNEIEMDMFEEAASKVPVLRVYADCPDVNETSFSNSLSVRLKNTAVVARHRADDTFPVVSAASIIAKVTRDRMIRDISEEFGTEIGSGYPSDTCTMGFIEKWIKDNGSPPKHTRCSWEPVRHMMSLNSNTKLTDW
ncbi:MAG: ribonuclease HII [Candidatus Methanomethylophilaceae archaeon]|nr:ribonuclease HII [Candidatus Methanomethylophilaceae archaeon]